MTLDATRKVVYKSALELSTGRENFTGLVLCSTPESPGAAPAGIRPRRCRRKGTFAVGDILVRCPHKGTPVRTGLRTEWVLLHSLPRVGVPLHCSACGEMHKWFPQDAWISVGVQPCAADVTDQFRTAEVKA